MIGEASDGETAMIDNGGATAQDKGPSTINHQSPVVPTVGRLLASSKQTNYFVHVIGLSVVESSSQSSLTAVLLKQIFGKIIHFTVNRYCRSAVGIDDTLTRNF